MLNPNTEKRNEERLIFTEEVPLKGAVSSPFENNNDLVLSGTIASLGKGQLAFRKGESGFSSWKDERLVFALRANQIDNAAKDLTKFPGNPYLLNNLGLAYLGSGQQDKAIELFKQALEAKHDFREAALNLALVYIQNTREQEAMNIYETLLRKYPQDTRVLINVADIYIKTKKLLDARNILEDILRTDPVNIAAANRLGIIDLIERNYTKAISHFRKCLQIDVRLSSVYNNIGVAYGLAGSLRKAISSFKTAINISPNYVSAIENLATTLRINNDLSDAIDLLENYLRQHENIPIRELLARFYAESGQHHKALRLLSIALSNATKVGLSEDEAARLHNNIGVIYTLIGDLKNAETHYLDSLKKAKQANQIVLTNLIDLYFAEHRIEKAKEYIDFLHQAFEGANVYFYYLGLYNYHSQKVSEAVSSISSFLQRTKTFVSAYSVLSFIFSEHLYEYKKAIELNKEALKYLQGNIHIVNNLAYNYLMDNDINSARELLERVKSVTNHIFLTATNGLLKIKEGDIEEGSRLYNLAASFAPNETLRQNILQKKHLELARYYWGVNKENDARTNLDKALVIKAKESVYARQALELREKLFSRESRL